MRRVLAALALVLLIAIPGVVQARMSPHRWPAGTPVLIQSNLGAAWMPHIRLVGEKWDNKSGPVSFHYTNGAAGCNGPPIPHGRIVLCWKQLPGWTADAAPITTINDPHTIVRCQIALDPEWTMIKGFYRTLSHEIGHCLGAEHHNITKNSVMYPHDDGLAPFATEFDGQTLRMIYTMDFD